MTNIFSRLRKQTNNQQQVIIVSGLPRSGTSLMMQILEAGGLEIVTDQVRTPDDDNPKGYYEFERVKKLNDGDSGWLESAQGKVVKVISALLEHLPPAYGYKVIFMQRKMDEVLASQRQMLIRRGEPSDKVSDEKMAESFNKHLAKITSWLDQQPNIEVLYVRYGELLSNPRENIEKVLRFLDMPLDLQAMLAVPDKTLYRQRS